jgi:hypothetical protein
VDARDEARARACARRDIAASGAAAHVARLCEGPTLPSHRSCSAPAAHDFAGGNIVGVRNVPTQGVWLVDEGPGGAVDKARHMLYRRRQRSLT